jgi:PEP-CTERM motif
MKTELVRHLTINITTSCILLMLVMALAGTRASALVVSGFNSGIISFDYSYPGIYPGYSSGPGGIGSAGDIWNVASIIDQNPVGLETTTGQATSAVWTFSTEGGQGATIGGTYGPLFESSSVVISATITGLTPNQAYDLYMYGAYWNMIWDVNGVDLSTTGIRFGSVNTLTDGVNYDVETVVADATGTLTFSNVSAQNGAPEISSWQLTPVPEPSTLGLLALGAGAFLIRWKRQRQSED